MVIIPVGADERETQYVDQQARDQRLERGEGVARRRPEFEHHDGDDDGEHPVAEGFQASGTHFAWGLRCYGWFVVHVPRPPSLGASAPTGIWTQIAACMSAPECPQSKLILLSFPQRRQHSRFVSARFSNYERQVISYMGDTTSASVLGFADAPGPTGDSVAERVKTCYKKLTA